MYSSGALSAATCHNSYIYIYIYVTIIIM